MNRKIFKSFILTVFIIGFMILMVLQLKTKETNEIYFTPSSGCEELIVNRILGAKKEIKIIIYSITNDNIVNAIEQAYRKNIDVKIIADRSQSKNRSSLIHNLIDYGIPIRISKRYKIEHNKVSIIDKNTIITGSYNYTYNASHNNSENCILVRDKKHLYYNRFNELWSYYE